MAAYEIRAHHAFKNWVIVWRDGRSLGAFTSRTEADAFVRRQIEIDRIKQRMVKL